MRVPFLSNRVGDMIIYALRAGGYIADDLSADLIRGVENNASETDLLNLAVGLNYGSTGGGGKLYNTEDVYILIDSDDTNLSTPYTNYLRVGKGQNTEPIVNPYHDLFAIGSESGPNSDTIMCRIGPDTALLTAGQTFSAELHIGTDFSGGAAVPYLTLIGGSAGTTKLKSSYGLEVVSDGGGLTLNSDDYIIFEPFNVAGTAGMRMKADATDDTFTMELPHPFTEHSMIFGSARSDYSMRCAIGGRSGVQHYDPNDLLIGGGYTGHFTEAWNQPSAHRSSLHIIAPNQSKRCTLSTWHRGTGATVATGTHLVNFHSDLDTLTTSNLIRFFSVTAFEGANKRVIFECRGDRSVYGYAWTTTHMDVAETFASVEPPADVEAGTVVVVNADGKAVAATIAADPTVLGVVSTQPGLTLGGALPGEDTGDTITVAMSGTVPVKCTTVAGDILAGDLLVTALEGRAQKAAPEDPPGARFGKALETLLQADDSTATGTIKMLVFNS